MNRLFLCIALSAGVGLAQSNRPSFLAADIHPSRHAVRAQVMGPFYTSGNYELRFATMADLIQMAYGIDTDRVYGGPSWLEYNRYDVIAKAPPGSSAESRKLMLQALLEDRFRLKMHQDTRPMLAYKLTAAKSKLQESDGSGEVGCEFKMDQQAQKAPPPPPPPSPGGGAEPMRVMTMPQLTYACHNTTMAAFAAALPSAPALQQFFGNKSVADQTGLKGTYSFSINYTPPVPAGMQVAATDAIPITEALEKQLGLKLETGTVPMPVVQVDSASEKPTDNPPGTEKLIPPPPTEFEVAEVKPSAADTPGGPGGGRPSIQNGRLIVQGISVRNLISIAYDIQSDDALSGAPKWLNQDRFDVIAKAPDGVQIGDLNFQGRSIPLNIEAIRPMLQSMLAQKFKLVVHTEQRPLSGFQLVAVKPKMQKAEPNSRTKWHEGPTIDAADRDPKDGKDPRNSNPALGRLVTCQNMTMAQFASYLPDIAPGYVRNEVIDATGLEGGYNFTLSFSANGVVQGMGGRGERGAGVPPGADAASDPSGGISLPDAMLKQLGLKLEEKKRPSPVLVIDHIEEKPVDN